MSASERVDHVMRQFDEKLGKPPRVLCEMPGSADTPPTRLVLCSTGVSGDVAVYADLQVEQRKQDGMGDAAWVCVKRDRVSRFLGVHHSPVTCNKGAALDDVYALLLHQVGLLPILYSV